MINVLVSLRNAHLFIKVGPFGLLDLGIRDNANVRNSLKIPQLKVLYRSKNVRMMIMLLSWIWNFSILGFIICMFGRPHILLNYYHI